MKKKDRIAAIAGLSPAVGATIAYTTRCEQGFTRDLKEEQRLHGLWFDASASVSQYDKDLAIICREKSKYWLEYENYDHMKTIDLGIELSKLEVCLEDLKNI
ncbi:hypothetical protein [Escherichia coli]|uniref:hypothetical protein n=1 Tax=Escherichia coli TaxID=562 RepID=UPI000CFB1363|nr:hypothetical protein [Escherichia coli]